MKTLIFLVVIAFIASAVNSMTPTEQRQQMIKIAGDCKVSEKATDRDLTLLMLKKPYGTPEGKCLFACIVEKINILSNMKFNKDAFIEATSIPSGGDPKTVEKLNKIADECEKITASDRCELAAKAGECFNDATIKYKINLGF